VRAPLVPSKVLQRIRKIEKNLIALERAHVSSSRISALAGVAFDMTVALRVAILDVAGVSTDAQDL
jgi:hypothetical protein